MSLGAARCYPPAPDDQERLRWRQPSVQFFVKILHELRRGSVSDTPQRHQRRAGPRGQKGMREPNYSLTPNPAAQGCLASGQRDEIRMQPEPVDCRQIQPAVAEDEVGLPACGR